MKKILLLVICLAATVSVYAQSENYQAFKVDIGFGYALPATDNSEIKGGPTFTIHPHYRLTDDLAVGIRLEGAALSYRDNSLENPDLKLAVLASYCATAEYYLANGRFRPFIGAGAGYFYQSKISTDSNTSGLISYGGNTKFGYFPEVGFEIGHLRVMVDYDVLPNKGGYAGFKFGFFTGQLKRRQ